MLRIGPPKYRLPHYALDKNADYIASSGVEFRFSTTVGQDVLFKDLLRDYDAVYIAVGTHRSRTAHIDNEDRALLGLDILKAATLSSGY